MTKGFSLKTRLTLWSLIALAFLMSVGGFFFYSNQYQQLHENLDNSLQLAARDFSILVGDIDHPEHSPNDFCQTLDQFSLQLEEKLSLTLYSSNGDLLCTNQPPLNQAQELSPPLKRGALAGKTLFTTVPDENGINTRFLTYPVVRDGRTLLILQLARSLKQTEKQQELFLLFLLAMGGLTLVGFGAFHRLLLKSFSTPLASLAQHLSNMRGENLQKYQPPAASGEELENLFESFNNLIDRLEHSLQRTRQFSADVTHELRTPLTILKGETELALRNNKSRDQLLQVLSSNLEEIYRMIHLIEDLLMLSKSELGEVPLKMEALNLSSLLLELFSQAQILAETKQIQVELTGADEQVSLFADGQRLRQVFLNLLSNAIKYTPEGGRIGIHSQLEGKRVKISIEDTGIGIDSQHLKYIFDRFYRIDKTRNRDDGGSGLGLAIAKWIVDAHQGSINVSSTPGQGSSFTVILPLTKRSD